jgi:hypothetical protein
MPTQPLRPGALQWQVFRGSEAVAHGLLTGHQLRSKAWVRIRHDVYADARLDRDHRLVCRATMARLPDTDAVLAGPSAAYLHGVRHAAGVDDEVHVIVPIDQRASSQRGMRLHRVLLDLADTQVIDGMPVTTPPRTAWDVAVWRPLTESVPVIDSMLRLGRVTPAQLSQAANHLSQRPGGRRAQHAFDLADRGAPSRAESVLRMRLVLSGLPRPVAQPQVTARDGIVLQPNVAWPAHRVAIEYGGVRDAGPDELDRQRFDALVFDGWRVMHVTAHRVKHDFPAVVREARDALRAQARRSPPGGRREAVDHRRELVP